MLEQAIMKINKEIEEKDRRYITVVGNFLKDYLKIDPTAAEKIMNENKTIEKSIRSMREAANEQKVDNVAVLTKEEGFEIVLRYYEIDPVDPTNDLPL